MKLYTVKVISRIGDHVVVADYQVSAPDPQVARRRFERYASKVEDSFGLEGLKIIKIHPTHVIT